jgi:hypothetical protein
MKLTFRNLFLWGRRRREAEAHQEFMDRYLAACRAKREAEPQPYNENWEIFFRFIELHPEAHEAALAASKLPRPRWYVRLWRWIRGLSK